MKQEAMTTMKDKVMKLKERAYKFEHVGLFGDGEYAYATLKDSKSKCIIDLEGNVITELDSANISYFGEFSEGLSVIGSTKDSYGVIDVNGNTVIECEYDFINKFYNGLSVVKKDGLSGVINSKNEVVIPFKYRGLSFNMKDGIGRFTILKDKYESTTGYIDIEGNEIVFDSMKVIAVSYLTVSELLSQEPIKVTRVRDIKLGDGSLYSIRCDEYSGRVLFKVTADNCMVIYQVSGNLLKSNENIFSISRDYFGITTKGYCDIYGDMLFESKHIDSITNFENGFGVIGTRSDKLDYRSIRYSFINSEGKIMAPFKYNSIYPLRGESIPYKKNIAKVVAGKNVGLINTNGEEIVECKYKRVMVIYHCVAVCRDSYDNLSIELF